MKKETCPRCFEEMREEGLNALSRRDNKTEICTDCGTAEALSDFKENREDWDKTEKEANKEKKKISISIDKYDADCGGQFYRIIENEDWETPAEFCGGSGYYLDEYAIDEAIDDAREQYDITILNDYR